MFGNLEIRSGGRYDCYNVCIMTDEEMTKNIWYSDPKRLYSDFKLCEQFVGQILNFKKRQDTRRFAEDKVIMWSYQGGLIIRFGSSQIVQKTLRLCYLVCRSKYYCVQVNNTLVFKSSLMCFVQMFCIIFNVEILH